MSGDATAGGGEDKDIGVGDWFSECGGDVKIERESGCDTRIFHLEMLGWVRVVLNEVGLVVSGFIDRVREEEKKGAVLCNDKK